MEKSSQIDLDAEGMELRLRHAIMKFGLDMTADVMANGKIALSMQGVTWTGDYCEALAKLVDVSTFLKVAA